MTAESILVPLDGSPESEAVLLYASAAAQAYGCSLLLLRVIESEQNAGLFVHPERDYYVDRSLCRDAEGYLDRLVALLRACGTQASSKVASGVPSKKIVQIAENQQVSMIAMATHGRRGMQRWALGSVADQVMRLSSIPTLLVRPAADVDPCTTIALRRLLVPLDGSSLAEAALEPAAILAQATGAKLILLRVEPWVNPALSFATEAIDVADLPELENAAESFARAYLSGVARCLPREVGCDVAVLRGTANVIEDYVKTNAIDLVVMSTHGRSGLPRLIMGSTASSLVCSGVPTLLIRPDVMSRVRGRTPPEPAAAGPGGLKAEARQ